MYVYVCTYPSIYLSIYIVISVRNLIVFIFLSVSVCLYLFIYFYSSIIHFPSITFLSLPFPLLLGFFRSCLHRVEPPLARRVVACSYININPNEADRPTGLVLPPLPPAVHPPCSLAPSISPSPVIPAS